LHSIPTRRSSDLNCLRRRHSFEKNSRRLPSPFWPNWNRASERRSTPRRPITWYPAEIPKTFKHTIHFECSCNYIHNDRIVPPRAQGQLCARVPVSLFVVPERHEKLS